MDEQVAYVVLTESGEQQTLTPAEFSKRFRWKNDPTKALRALETVRSGKPATAGKSPRPDPLPKGEGSGGAAGPQEDATQAQRAPSGQQAPAQPVQAASRSTNVTADPASAGR